MLRFRADLRTLAFIGAYFGALAWAWSLPLGRTPVVAAAVGLLCWLSWINGVITHNVMHTPIWRSRRMNRVTRAILSMTYGFPVSYYIPGHNRSHHPYMQTARDPMRTTKVRFRWNLLNLLAFFPTVAPDVKRANAHYARLAQRSRPRWSAQRRVESFVTWGAQVALLLVDWRKALLFVLVPHLSALWGVTTVNFLWHDGCDEADRYNHSRNFVGKGFNWFHFNAGFHTVHHDEPGLHWSLLPARHAATVAPFIHPALEQRSFAYYLIRSFALRSRRLRYDGAQGG